MRTLATLALVALVLPVSAQTAPGAVVPDTAVVGPDAVVSDTVAVADTVAVEAVVRTVVRRPGNARLRTVDTVRREAPARSARLAFPTEGGVFYYRAGPGTAVRRVQPAAAALPLAEARARAASAPSADTPASPADTSAALTAGPVSQRDLDRLERRLTEAVDRRLDGDRTRTVAPVPVAPGDRPVARPRLAPVTGAPARLDRLPVSPLDSAAPPVTVEEVERAILDTGLFRTSRVFFAFGEADILPVSAQVLDVISDVLVRYPDLRVEVGGHTDAISSDAFNQRLSEARAASVAAALVARGVDVRRLTAVGYGEARPVADNETETGRALNRRVEFVVLGE